MGRSLSALGLLACFAAVAGTGCGGGTKYGDDSTGGAGSGIGSNPNIVSNAPTLTVEGARDQIVIIATENLSPGGDLIPVPDNPKFLKVSATESAALNYPSSYTLLAPRIWADRKFKEWQLNGTVIDTDTTLGFSQIPASMNGTLKAVYEPYVLPAGEDFAPNYQDTLVALYPWQILPLNVWIDPQLTPNAGAKQLFYNGLNKWVRASGGVINYNVVNSAGEADVRFRSASGLTNLPEGVLGVTLPFQMIDDLNANSDYTDIYLIRVQFAAQNAVDRLDYEATVAHEFGHALGMIGHSAHPTDLMYPFNGPLEVTQNDINSVANLYKGYFDGGNTIPTRAAHRSGTNSKVTLKSK